MIEITRFPFVRHLRADNSVYVLHFRRGKLRQQGKGLSFWFMPLSSSLAAIPMDDREVHFLFHGRSADFQDVTAQGVITYRVVTPETLIDHVDFSIGVNDGRFIQEPLDQIAQLLTQLAQQVALEHMVSRSLKTLVSESVDPLRVLITKTLNSREEVDESGLAVVSVRIAAIQATPELERALQTPAMEAIQQESDEATFQRRAFAVEKERAIQENELQNQIELARQREQLIAQEGQNARHQATEEAEALKVVCVNDAERTRMTAAARADEVRLVEKAKSEAEEAHVDLYRELSSQVMMGLAAQELAGKLTHIDHVYLSPDMIGPLLTDLMVTATDDLKQRGQP